MARWGLGIRLGGRQRIWTKQRGWESFGERNRDILLFLDGRVYGEVGRDNMQSGNRVLRDHR